MENVDSSPQSENSGARAEPWRGLTINHLESFEEKLSHVDRSITSLARSLDVMDAAVFKEYQRSTKAHQSDIRTHNDADDLTLQLLYKLQESVVHSKTCAVKSLSDFLHFYFDCTGQLTKHKDNKFDLDTYLSKDNESGQFISRLQMTTAEVIVENARLSDDIERSYKHEKNLKEKNQILSDKIQKLEHLTDYLRSQNGEKDRQISDINAEIRNLTKDSNTLHHLEEELKEERKTHYNLQQKLLDFEIQTSLLTNSISEKDRAIESSRIDFSNKLNNLEREKGELEKKYENDISNKKQDIESYSSMSSKIEELRRQLNYLEEEKVDLKLKCENEIKTSQENMTAQINETEKQNARKLQEMNTRFENLAKKTEEQSHAIVTAEAKIESLVTQNEEIEDRKKHEISVLQMRIKGVEKSEANMSNKYKEMLDQKEQIQTELNKIEHEKQSLENNVKEKEDKIRQLQMQINEEKEEQSRLHKENQSIKAENYQSKKSAESLMKEKESLSLTVQNGIDAQKRLQKQTEEYENEVQRLAEEMKDIRQQLFTTNKEHLSYEKRTSGTIRQLERNIADLKEENNDLKQELEDFKRKKIIQVQIYYQRRSGLISTVEEELLCLLKSKMESKGKIALEFINCVDVGDVKPDIPVLLLCISASRIGTDAANTIHGLNLSSKMSLLIFHHKDEHALPSQASYQILTGKEFTVLGGICDLAFLTVKGIYKCRMNEASIEKIVNFIDTEGVRK